jgi:fructosamine-3-kinase
METKQKQRTGQQNAALHLYFTQLAEALNSAGFDMKKTIREDVDIPWTPENIKEFLWRKVQQAYLRKKSTTELTTEEIDKVYDVVNKVIAERTGVHIPFPSIDSAIDAEREKEFNK